MSDTTLPPDIADRTVFLVWGPPSHGNRTRVLAGALGIEVRHVFSTKRRGALAAPQKYPYQAVATVRYLLRRRPAIVFVQNPPSFAALLVAVYAVCTGAGFVVDSHTDAFVSPYWTRPRWLYRWLARRALLTLVTGTHYADEIEAAGGRAMVLRDVPTSFEHSAFAFEGPANIAVVSTFAGDEPFAEVVEAARGLPEVTFHVTGDPNRENASLPASIPDNVRLTGFLANDQFYGLLHDSDAVMCLTTRDHTMQRGACEALSVGTPVITSDWPLLQGYFRKGTVHVDNTPDGIGAGVEQMLGDRDRYRSEILELRAEVREEWRSASAELATVLAEALGDSTPSPPVTSEVPR